MGSNLKIRYGFTVASTIFIYVVTWVSLKSGSESDRSPEVGSNDAVYFQRPVYMGLCIGFLTSLAFHWGVEENSEWNQQNRRRNQKTVSQFLKDRNFYQVIV